MEDVIIFSSSTDNNALKTVQIDSPGNVVNLHHAIIRVMCVFTTLYSLQNVCFHYIIFIADPSTAVTNTFDVVGTAYTDDECTEPTGDTEIISNDLWGNFGSGDTCTTSGDTTVGNIDTVCLPDGTIVVQAFAPSDDSCSGDVWYELVLDFTNYQSFYSYCSAESYGLYYL